MKIKAGTEKEYQEYKDRNSDPYGKCVVDYSEAWADAMEEKMSKGEKLEDIAQATSHEVDRRPEFGITGFMYGCAVQGLAFFWEHGEALRIWHNKDYGVENSDGVVNPAVVVVGEK